MKAFFVSATAAFAVAASLVPAAVTAETDPWTYKAHESELYSPPQWFRKYPDCGGQRQSPIDITHTSETQTNPAAQQTNIHATLPIQFTGTCPSYNIKQYWESFKAESNSTAGACSLGVNGKPYTFAQVHFHAPSEHTIKGKTHDGEIHFVHKNSDGTIAVVGLFIEKTKLIPVGKSDPFFCNFLAALKRVNETNPVGVALGEYAHAVKASIPKGKVFNYPGSLTTPACSEVVDWWVIETPLQVSHIEFEEIHTELKRIGAADEGKNARPTQPLNGRIVTVY